jgi:hypothetical protein
MAGGQFRTLDASQPEDIFEDYSTFVLIGSSLPNLRQAYMAGFRVAENVEHVLGFQESGRQRV